MTIVKLLAVRASRMIEEEIKLKLHTNITRSREPGRVEELLHLHQKFGVPPRIVFLVLRNPLGFYI